MEVKEILSKCDHTLLTQTATCPDHAAQMETYCRENGVRLKVHIAVDTGMHRIGFLPEDLDAILRMLMALLGPVLYSGLQPEPEPEGRAKLEQALKILQRGMGAKSMPGQQ